MEIPGSAGTRLIADAYGVRRRGRFNAIDPDSGWKGDSELQLRDALAILRQSGPELDRSHIEHRVAELGLDHEWALLLEELE